MVQPLNHTFLLGTVTRTPTFRQTARGTPITTFDLQLDPTERGEGWILGVIGFGKQAKPAARQLGRGSLVFVAGRLRQWERVTQEGQKERSFEIVAERVEFLSEPAARTAEIARAFIDAPAVVAEADAPAPVSEADPPASDQ